MSVRFKQDQREGGLRSVEVECYRSLNLLAHAQMEELGLGSECGGHGVCGKDRVQILAGEVSPVTDTERGHLNARLLEQGWRLACQCFPESDLAGVEARVPLVERRGSS